MTFQEKIKAINDFEKSEGYPQNSLLRPMLFETAGTLDTTIQNAASKAVGLIQWLPITLSYYGLTTTIVKTYSFAQQLNLVREYLKPYRSKLLATKDPLDFYLSILYPALIGKPDSAIMAKKGTATYTQNAGLDSNKDGIITKGDIRVYFYRVTDSIAKKKGINLTTPLIGLFVFIISATIIFLILKS